MTSPIQQSSQPPSDMFRRALNGMILGGKIMLLQTPFVTGLNRVSVVCCHRNLSAAESIREIYLGNIDGLKKPSSIHFLKGVSGHLFKELSRLGFKTFGIMEKPCSAAKVAN